MTIPSNIQSPHDKLVKKSLEHVAVAVDFLKAHLPIELQAHIDWQHMQLQESNFISTELKGTTCDVLYKVKLFDEDSYIWILIEHQSTQDKLMPLRILRYTMQIIEKHLHQNQHNKANKCPIPMVVPLVFYSGKTKYTYSTDIIELVNAPVELVNKFFLKPSLLVELRDLDTKNFMQHMLAGVFEAVLKYNITDDWRDFVVIFSILIKAAEQEGLGEYIQSTVKYALNVSDYPNPVEFVQQIASALQPKTQAEIMTMAARLEEKGRKEGRQEGRQEGLKEGIKEGIKEGMTRATKLEKNGRKEGKHEMAIAIAKSLLKEGMSISKIAEITQLDVDEIPKIQH